MRRGLPRTRHQTEASGGAPLTRTHHWESVVTRYLASLFLLATFATTTNAQTPPDRAAFLNIYRELVETNTTYSSGDCTRAAKQHTSHKHKTSNTKSELS